jgi:hypothetical protein
VAFFLYSRRWYSTEHPTPTAEYGKYSVGPQRADAASEAVGPLYLISTSPSTKRNAGASCQPRSCDIFREFL